jgi:pantoate--beta-alanine ligase
VNPTQFGPKEDFSRYPRDLKRDLRLCRANGADVVFAPSDKEMYPRAASPRHAVAATFSTYVVEDRLTQRMEGLSRPTHFRGVTTVVAKLFNIVRPAVAVFGQKDFQQAVVVKRMVADLNFSVKIVVGPTVREPDGLALSSRNKYLDAHQRPQATILRQAILRAQARVRQSSVSSARLAADMKKFIASAQLARLDYVEFFDPRTLEPIKQVKRGTHMALAVFFGETRLIDNDRL